MDFESFLPADVRAEDLVWVADRQLNVVWTNDAWQRFALDNGGDRLADQTGAISALDSMSGGHQERWRALTTLLLNGSLQKHEEEFICPSPSKPRHYRLSVFAAGGRPGRADWLIHHSQQLDAGNRDAARLAFRVDGLDAPETATAAYRKQVVDRVIKLDEFEVAQRTLPLEDIGGDLLWHHEFDDGSADMVVGDVMGHGLAAGRIANRIVLMLEILADKAKNPAELVEALNQSMLAELGDSMMYATGLYLRMLPATRTLLLCSFGHLPPVFSRLGLIELEAGPPVGLSEQFQGWGCQSLEFEQLGCRFIVFSDGLIEQFDAQGEMFGTRRLHQCLQDTLQEPVENVVELLFERLETFRGQAMVKDDRMACVVQWKDDAQATDA